MKTPAQIIVFAGFIFLTYVISNAQQTITDIDGNVYHTVRIGNQVWMKENLKTTKYNNGDAIATTSPATKDISGESTPKYQWAYEGNDSNVTTYGRLYTWYTVTDNRKVCPVGWHLPTDDEWIILTNYLGGDVASQGKLKEAGTEHWESPNSDATNESGFTAMPGGNRWVSGLFIGIGTFSHWWTATEDASDKSAAWRRILVSDDPAENFRGTADKKIGWAVRCIEDPIPDSAKYFGQTPPGETPEIFAPEIISKTDRLEIDITFSPDGKECYFGAASSFSGNFSKIYYTKFVNNIWTEQEEAPFSVNHITASPFLSANGNKLYFDYSTDTSCHIWMVERTAEGWGESQLLPSPINSNAMEYGYRETSNNVIYLSSNRDGDWGIWCIHPETNQAVNLGPTMNSMPYIAPDESFLIFSKSFPENDYRQYLYISFNKGNNEWSAPIDVNSSGSIVNNYNDHQVSPSLSPDGKYLFFGRHSHSGSSSDIYWVSTSIIDTLKKIAFPNSVVDAPEAENFISIFPNPGKGVFTISIESSLGKNTSAEIYNINGKLVLEQTLNNSISTIDLSGYPAGMYFLKVNTGTAIMNKKIIKE